MKCCIGIHVPETPFRSVADVLILMELEWRQIIFFFSLFRTPSFCCRIAWWGGGEEAHVWCHKYWGKVKGFPGGTVVKIAPADAGDTRDMSAIPGLQRSPGKISWMATHSLILALEIPWTEKPGRPQAVGSQRVRHDWAAEHICTQRRHRCFSYTGNWKAWQSQAGLFWVVISLTSALKASLQDLRASSHSWVCSFHLIFISACTRLSCTCVSQYLWHQYVFFSPHTKQFCNINWVS